MAESIQTGPAHITFVSGTQPTDIIELIMTDHRRIRRLGAALEDRARRSGDSGRTLLLAWQRLAGLLEAHTRAEEEICYLPMFGHRSQAAEDRRTAIDDHDDIREALSEAALQPPGSALWWRAVRWALAVSADHFNREEHGLLAESLTRLNMSRRRELGRQWSAFVTAWRLDSSSRA